MSIEDVVKLALLVFVGLFVLADGVLFVARPELMWSYASHTNYALRWLLVVIWVGFGLHLATEWWGWLRT